MDSNLRSLNKAMGYYNQFNEEDKLMYDFFVIILAWFFLNMF